MWILSIPPNDKIRNYLVVNPIYSLYYNIIYIYIQESNIIIIYHNITALDAYCLLEIYATLEIQCEHLDIPFYDVCLEVQHTPHQLPERNMRKPTQKVVP